MLFVDVGKDGLRLPQAVQPILPCYLTKCIVLAGLVGANFRAMDGAVLRQI
jgi:hypothetical protein